MKNLSELLLKPFKDKIHILFLFFVLISLLDFYACLIYNNGIPRSYAVCVLSRGFMDSYFITLGYTLIHPKILRSIYSIFVSTIVSIFFLTDAFCVIGLNRRFDSEGAHVILGSNIQESIDFLLGYLSFSIIFFLILFVGIMALSVFLIKKIHIKKSIAYVLFICVCLSVILNIYVPGPCFGATLGKISLFVNTPRVPNLKDHLTHPTITITERQPQNIVMIIGESFAKTHSSLYGYSKETNPLLSKLKKDSLLYTYDNVTTEGLHTIQAFKSFMSTYSYSSDKKKEWYECTTIPEVVHGASYQSYWISNQSYKGYYDNVVSRYAELCDNMNFVGDKLSSSLKRDYDELVLQPLVEAPKDSLKFFFIHLMGSHVFFEHRYPSHFNKFKESDYFQYPEHQRKTLATYDNSVLYNDSVINQIIHMFDQKEAIVFYFSDHAIDIYDSSDTFVGHGNANIPVSAKAGRSIPFMIYFSPLYQKNFPEKFKDLTSKTNEDYSTTNLIYTILDVMGAKAASDTLN